MARILLVDDSMYQRLKLRKILEAAGYEVIEGTNGEEGLYMAASSEPDCILLDLIMPKIGGIEVLREFHAKHFSLPVIIHTADIQESTRQECMELGAVAFLNKPAREEDLLAALELALARKGKETGHATTT